MLTNNSYNPDVLSCIANLSSDEVFTPPGVANEILDLLPSALWSNKDAKFLDPVCKSGVFLREIAKRLLDGLEKQIPNLQERIDHIFQHQLYGIAITELTGLLSRRSVYCSKMANGKYSISEFNDEQGNILFSRIKHKWKNNKCEYCGANQVGYDRSKELETHAYQLIHTDEPEAIFNMKFDVVVGNPPYQLSDAGDSTGASPIYNSFVDKAKALNPRFLSMIIPSRWFAGGKGLGDFRSAMLQDKRISHLVDYPIASDVFPGVKINGGVCYFLWERDRNGPCEVTTVMNGERSTRVRELNQFNIFVRFNQGISIIEKVIAKKYPSMSGQVSTQKPFGLRTFVRPSGKGEVTLYANNSVGGIRKSEITMGRNDIDRWKVITSMGYGEGGEAREYPRMIIGKPIVCPPPSACTETYIVAGAYDSENEARNLDAYLRTKFLRFLVAMRKNTQHVTKDRFEFVPKLTMETTWTDAALYEHFGLTKAETSFIDSLIKPMEAELF